MLPVPLLLLLDSRSPAGAHQHSGGMEAAVMYGWVQDVAGVERFCRGRLRTAAPMTATAAAHAARLDPADGTGWVDLDRAVEARTPSEAARTASRALGAGLRRLLFATAPAVRPILTSGWLGVPGPAPHVPLVWGAATAVLGGSPALAGRAVALSLCTGAASAAVRLLGLDPYAVHAMVTGLAAEIEAVGDAAALTDVIPAGAAPALDLLADVHAAAEVRLFAS